MEDIVTSDQSMGGMMPIETKQDLTPPKEDSIVQVQVQRFTQTQADTLSTTSLFCDGVNMQGFMYDFVLTGKLRRIQADGTILPDIEGNTQTLIDSAKMLVRQVEVSVNGRQILVNNGLSTYNSIQEQLEADNEDESLAYYHKCDELLNADGSQ